MAKRVEELQRVHARALQTFTQQLPAQVRRGVGVGGACMCGCSGECEVQSRGTERRRDQHRQGVEAGKVRLKRRVQGRAAAGGARARALRALLRRS